MRRITAIAALALGLTAAVTAPASASTAVRAVTAGHDASGSSYAGEVTFDNGNWCLGSKPNPQTGKPGPGSLVWWVPCNEAGYFKDWVIDVVRTRAGNLAQAASAADPDVCFSEGSNTLVVLQHCRSLSDQSWMIARQLDDRNAWTLELYGRFLTSVIPLDKISKAAWSSRQASIIQFPPNESHTG
jgi:hypothetical protein